MPWDMMAQAEGSGETYEEYSERIGLNDPKPEFEIDVDDPLDPITTNTMDEESIPKGEEVLELRTAFSKVYSNGDGTLTEHIYPEPIHNESEDGEFLEIQSVLKKDKSKKSFVSTSTDLKVQFPEKVSAKGKYVNIKNGEHSIEYQLLNAISDSEKASALEPLIEQDGERLYHREVFPSIDLRSILFDTSLKEDIILNEVSSFHTFEFQVHTDLNGKVEKDGSISWKTGNETVFVTPAPFMEDSNINEQSGEPSRSDDVSFKLKKNTDGYLLTLSADKDWLAESKRVYPVYIDPTTSLPVAHDTFVSSAYPSANYEKHWESSLGYYSLRAGSYDSSTGTQYSYIKHNVDHLKGANIESASFNIYTAHSYYATTANGLWIDSVNASWSPTTVTWNNKPASTAITSTNTMRDTWAEFDVTTTVKKWVDGSLANNGFKLHTNGNGQTHWKKFYASENSTNKPYLSVTYSYPQPAKPTVTAVNYNDGSETGYLNVSWPKVANATDYIVYIFNGDTYQGFRTGDVTSWTTKDKKLWPTEEQEFNGVINLSSTGTGRELPVDPSSTYAVSSNHYASTTRYYVRVQAEYPGGKTPTSEAALPHIPLSKAQGVEGAASVYRDNETGYISIGWDPVSLADGYRVFLFNGKTYQQVADIPVDPKNPNQSLKWSSQGKKVWPTATDISSGIYNMRPDGTGAEIPRDPRSLYQYSDPSYYANSLRVYARVVAYDASHPQSTFAPFVTQMPDYQEPIGTESYWPTHETPVGTVNAINGNLTFSETDFSLSGRGPSIEWGRTFNSRSTQIGSFGKGWLSSYDIQLEELANKDVRMREEDGTVHLYKYVSEGVYTASHGLYLPLTKVGTEFVLTTKSQDKLYFSGGRLTKIEDGERKENIVTLAWSDTQLVITDASGRKITATINNGRFTKITDYASRTWSYSYTGDRLTGYTDPSGANYQYIYTNDRLTGITDAKGEMKSLAYDSDGRLNRIEDELGVVTTLSYETEKASINYPATRTGGISKDTISFNLAGNPTELVTDVGGLNLKSTFTYELNELIKSVDPRQGQETAQYDQDGNIIESIGANGDTEKAIYNGNNDVIRSTDAMGEVYSSAYDGLLEVSTNDPSKTSSVAEHDQFGNIILSSKEMSVAYNLLQNGGFETTTNTLTDWKPNPSGTTEGTLSLDTVDVMQKQAVKVTPTFSDKAIGLLTQKSATQIVAVEENTLYTLSALIKTQSLGGRAFFNVKFLKESTDGSKSTVGWADNRYHHLTGTNPWTERQLSLKTPAGVTHIEIYLEVDNGYKNLKGGSAIFDNVQLTYGQVSSTFNSVQNSGFELNDEILPTTFTNWTYIGALKGAYDYDEVFDGDYSLKVLRKASTGAAFRIQQRIDLKQQVATPLTLSALSMAEGVASATSTGPDQKYSILLNGVYSDGTKVQSRGYFAKGTHEWQKVIASIVPTKPIDHVFIEIAFDGDVSGTAWFDSVRLQEGRLVSKSEYDTQGNYLKASIDELGYRTEYTQDALGNVLSNKDALGNVTSYTYNKVNQLETTSLPGSDALIRYQYDADGNNTNKSVVSKANPATIYSQTQYNYDDAGQLISQSVKTDSKEYTTSFLYNSRGDVEETVYPNGSKVTSRYDSADRPVGLDHTLPNGTKAPVYTFTLDGNGNHTKIENHLTQSSLSQVFDKGNRVTQQSVTIPNASSTTVNWTFDKNDNVIQESMNFNGDIRNTGYRYDNLSNNTEVVGSAGEIYRMHYEEQGNVKSYVAPNGTGVLFDYDERGLVKKTNIGHNHLTNLVNYDYSYDANGNRIRQVFRQELVTSNAGTTQQGFISAMIDYTYDTQSQLISETLPISGESLHYEYDVLGNRVKTITKKGTSTTKTVEHVFNQRNQLVTVRDGISTQSWDYDDNGNLLSDGKFSYLWDADNRLRQVHKKSDGSKVAEYWYDEADRRIRKEVSGVVTNYVYDGDGLNVLYEMNGSGILTAYHTFNTNGQLLSRTEVVNSVETRYYYHYNAHGDVVMITRDSNKDVNDMTKSDLIVASYVYDAWGNIIYQEGSYADKNPYRYAGYSYDKETDHYYLMARYYNPKVGTFTSLDPNPGDDDDIRTQNGYTYANNNPVMLVDPDGHYVWLAVNAGFAAYDGYKAYKAGKKAGKKGWKLFGSVAFASGSSFVKFGHYKKVVGLVKAKKKTVWGKIKPTQSVNPGTTIPKSFTLSAGWKKIWVHPNATKHMVEYSRRRAYSHGRKITEQIMLKSLHAAVKQAVKQGIKFDRIMNIGGWELIFSAPRKKGQSIVLKHALYK